MAVRSAGCQSVRKIGQRGECELRGRAGWWRRKGGVFGRADGTSGGEVGEAAVGLHAGRIVGVGPGRAGTLGSWAPHSAFCLIEKKERDLVLRRRAL